ncbi:MAG TPA: hypothetical protein VHL14_12925, partial [Steroidobacteraceae bacterium]|nr:hypothetical protein [Steroidobacteraceae bacterium]
KVNEPPWQFDSASKFVLHNHINATMGETVEITPVSLLRREAIALAHPYTRRRGSLTRLQFAGNNSLGCVDNDWREGLRLHVSVRVGVAR